MRQLLPGAPSNPVDVYGGDRYLRANMVSSVDGAATVAGRVGGLTSDVDQRLLTLVREHADVVLVGAGTIRAEGYGPLQASNPTERVERGQTPHPMLVIATLSGELDLSAWRGSQQRPTVLIADWADPATVEALRTQAHVMVVPAAEDSLDWPEVIDRLRGEGHQRILTEGGPSLLGSLLGADLVTELCLTIGARTVGGEGIRITWGEQVERDFTVASVLEDSGELFVRYNRSRPE